MSVASPGIAVRRRHRTRPIAVVVVGPARVSIEAKSKSAETSVAKSAAKVAESTLKMIDVTAAHRKTATKATSAKATSPSAKTATPARERRRNTRRHHCCADGKCCCKRDHRLAHGISPFRADTGSKHEIAQRRHLFPGYERLFHFIVRTAPLSATSGHFSRVRGS
jgi:hypothetical protein